MQLTLQTTTTAGRLPGIDLLRGACALLVVLHHIDLRFRLTGFDVSSLLPAPIDRLVFQSGYFAVVAFFVISGFLITSLSMRRWQSLSQIEVVAFYRLRAARILPCLLLLVALLSLLHLAQAPGFVINPERSSLGRAVFAALTFHVNWLEGLYGYLPGSWDVLWSLSVEEVFYLVFPLACLLCRSERWLTAPVLCLIALGPVSRTLLVDHDPWRDYAYLSCMDGIAFGCLAALVATRVHLSRNTLRMLMGCGIAATLLIVAFRPWAAALGLNSIGVGVSLLEAGVAMMLVVISQAGASGFARRGRFVQFVGRCSYELYLSHMLVVLALMPLIQRLQPDGALIPMWYAVLLALSIILGWVVYRFWSEPMNRRLRRSTQYSNSYDSPTVLPD